jgi:hypothetical protein
MSFTYEQAIQGLFTAGTSVAPDLCKTGEGQLKEKVGCKRGIEDIDRCCPGSPEAVRPEANH